MVVRRAEANRPSPSVTSSVVDFFDALKAGGVFLRATRRVRCIEREPGVSSESDGLEILAFAHQDWG
jgi:hypothetical protein